MRTSAAGAEALAARGAGDEGMGARRGKGALVTCLACCPPSTLIAPVRSSVGPSAVLEEDGLLPAHAVRGQ